MTHTHHASGTTGGSTAHRGYALVMTLMAVAMAVVLAVTFSATSQTTTGIAQNSNNHSHSRLIAESAMVTSIGTLKQQDDWRTTLTSGVWASDVELNGGTYTISGEDGVDEDGDGIVDGDGDLADDNRDPVTVTVTGNFNGVTHRVRAVIFDGGDVPVTQVGALDKVEVKGEGEIDSWNSAAGSYNTTKGSDAIVSTSSTKKEKLKFKDDAQLNGNAYAPPGADPDVVIKVEGSATITGETGTQAIRQLVPGVDLPDDLPASSGNVTYSSGTTVITSNLSVNDLEIKSHADVQFDGNITVYVDGDLKIKEMADIYVTDGSRVSFYVKKHITIENSAEVNTDTDDPSRALFYSLGKDSVEIKGSAQVYGVFIAPGAEVKIKDTADLYGSFVGRKLKIENKGELHQDLNPISVPAGTTIFDNGGADYGLAADEEVEIKDQARVSGMDGRTARVSVNNNASDKLKLTSDYTVDGNAYVPPGADPNVVVKCDGDIDDAVTGEVGVADLTVAIDFDDIAFTGGNPKDKEYSSGTTTINSDQYLNKLTIKGTAVVNISGDVTIQCNEDFKMDDTAQLRVLSGSRLRMILLKKCDIVNNSQLNVTAGDPTAVEIHVLGSDHFHITNNAVVYATVMVPYTDFHIKDDCHFYGTARAKKVRLENRAHAHVLTEEGAGPPDLGTGKMTVRWLEANY